MPTPRTYASAAQRQAAYRLRCQGKAKAAAASLLWGLPEAPGRRRWRALCERACRLVAQAHREMEAYSEQHSEAWQESVRGEAHAELLEALAEITAALREVRTL
jgi:hypothetical protein